MCATIYIYVCVFHYVANYGMSRKVPASTLCVSQSNYHECIYTCIVKTCFQRQVENFKTDQEDLNSNHPQDPERPGFCPATWE
jgi:hypothetical protein